MNPANMTMTAMDAIRGRRSARSYVPERLDRNTLQTLLDAAVRAPTAMHGEPWRFLVVQDVHRLRGLSDIAKADFAAEAARLHLERSGANMFSQPEFNVFYDAGTLVVICARTGNRFAVADCWLAAANLMLAAHAMGLGSCVIGSAASALNHADVKRELGIPDDTEAIAPIIVGRPRGETLPTARNAPQVLAWL